MRSIALLSKKFVLALVSVIVSVFLLYEALFLMRKPGMSVGTIHTNKAKLYGWAPEPNKQMRSYHPDTAKLSFYKINSAGWKDVEHTVNKPEGVFRILFLGDSNTYGRVLLEELYTRNVEQIFKLRGFQNIEVISMAVGGWATDQLYEALVHEGFTYQPDLVVYQFCTNDVWEILPPNSEVGTAEIGSRKPFRYELQREKLVRLKVDPPKDNPPRFLSPGSLAEKNRMAKKYYWNDSPINPTSDFYAWNPSKESPVMDGAWKLFEALLAKMHSSCMKHKAEFVIFSEAADEGNREWQLMWKRFQTDATSDYLVWDGQRYPIDWNRPLKKLVEICEREQIPLIKPKRKYHRFKNDSHPNEAGNLAMALDIVEFLSAHKFVR